MVSIFFSMQRGDRIRHEVHVHNIDLVARAKRRPAILPEIQMPSPCRTGRLRITTVSKNNAGTKDRDRDFRQQLPDHVLAKFLGSRIRIVVGTIPLDGVVLRDDLIAAFPRNGHSTDLTESPQPVVIVRASAKLHHFQRPAQIYIQTVFSDLRFSDAAQ